jgi:GT2 family glycosyltransferase
MNLPSVSVIVLNYNGKHYLETCLQALKAQDYPSECFEVILVDNASSDGSVEMVRQQFPWVRLVVNRTNLGFGGGNNVGICVARGDYIAFLNNDTRADPRWLSALVETARKDERIGACTSKLVLFYDRLPLHLRISPGFYPCKYGGKMRLDSRELGIRILKACVIDKYNERPLEFIKGVYGEEFVREKRFRWTSSTALLGIPIIEKGEELCVEMRISLERPDNPKTIGITLSCEGRVLAAYELESGSETTIRLRIPGEFTCRAVPVIQNAGSVVSIDGSSRDRGAVVEGGFHYYEADIGQYNRREEVFAACGAASLWRKATLMDIGLFDEGFFMYYEDTDLSWRAHLRGWKIVYVPDAVVRHIHCGTSGEWSPLFTYCVKKNRLAMVFKNGSWKQILLSWIGYLYSISWLTASLIRVSIYNRRMSNAFTQRLKIELGAGKWIITHLHHLIKERYIIQKRRLVPQEEIERMLAPIPRLLRLI